MVKEPQIREVYSNQFIAITSEYLSREIEKLKSYLRAERAIQEAKNS